MSNSSKTIEGKMLDINPNILPHQDHHFLLSSNRVPPDHVISFISLHETTLSTGARPFCSTKRCQEERRRTGFGYATVRRVDKQNLHALSVASTASKFIIWSPSGIGKASGTSVGTERGWLIW
ncbi:hypothetical protein H0E87_007523, partial [Populus deltoides]